jgi:hypothetical protein
MPRPDLLVVAARHRLSLVSADEIPKLADALLSDGVCTDALCQLIDVRYPTLSEAGPLLEGVLRALGFPLPPVGVAIQTVAMHYARSIFEETVAPWEGFSRLVKVCAPVRDPLGAMVRSGRDPATAALLKAGYDLEGLFSLQSELSDYWWELEHISDAALREKESQEMHWRIRQWAETCHRNRGPAIPTEWLSHGRGIIRDLADAITKERAFGRLPVLADALEEAGCENSEILCHCRSGSAHVRNCWVTDLILVKS